MKKLVFVSSLALFVGGLACGPAGGGGSGGSTGSSSGGSTGASGGSTGSSSGGSTGTSGGATGTSGGSTGSSGGSTGSSGGSTGASGGSTGSSSGGSVGSSGGAGSGSGGRGTGGAATGTGGASTNTGGAGTGTGGRGTGGAGTGTGGAATGGSGAGGAAVTVASVIPALDGYLWIGTCAAGAPSSGGATDCPIYPDGTSTCPMPNAAFAMQGAFRTQMIPIAGTANQNYTVTFEVRGVAGGRCYNGGSRAPTLGSDPEGPTGNDGWYVGGTPIDGKWNTWEFHVLPPGGGAELGVYYLNAFPSTSIYCERHETFVFKYMASFPVKGGGMIKAVVHDSNCSGQQNCGAPNMQTTCGNPRTVSLVGMDPQPPTSFVQPPITNNYHPQWLFFDVKSVTSP